MHQPCTTGKVKEAREKLKRISQEYHRLPSTNMKIALISAKKALDDAYLDAEVDYINGKFQTSRKSTFPIDTILPGKQLRKSQEKIQNQTSVLKEDHQNNVFPIG